MASYIPALPEELHCFIAQQVHRDDLPNYRLASKQFCAISTEELFHTLIIQYSTRSVERLEAIASTDHLCKHVKTIFWDTNLWKIPDVDDLHEWKNYFTKKAAYYHALYNKSAQESVLTTQCTSLSNNRDEWDAYVDKVNDEKAARSALTNSHVFAKFQNMRTFHICNGTLVRSHRGIEKFDDCMYRPPEQSILRRGEGIHDCTRAYSSLPGFDAFTTMQIMPGLLLKELHLDRMYYSVFEFPVSGDFSKLTTLDLKITIRNDYTRDGKYRRLTDIRRSRPTLRREHLRRFLHSLYYLECLRIDLDSAGERQPIPYFRQPPSAIRDILGLEYVWPSHDTWSNLHTLSLCHFIASSESILSLLQRHSSTLKDLSLRNIMLDKSFEVMNMDEWDDAEYRNAPGSGLGAEAKLSTEVLYRSWPHVLQTLHGDLLLERARLSGLLGVKCHGEGWNLDHNKELAVATEEYLLNGGQMPLDESNCVGRNR